jgi:bifunctional NMN adenylyltransferase/nudix hydrolase
MSAHSVGVIVARFQVPELHAGHRHLIAEVLRRHPKAFIVLGDHGGLRTDRDPLTFKERAAMIEEAFPADSIMTGRLRDHPFCHKRWSAWLDELIESKYHHHKVVLYGSRDSFLDLYTGGLTTQLIPAISTVSGTEQRKAIVHSPAMTARQAIIHHEMMRPAIAYSAADIAIVDDARERVLVITKHWFDGMWSLPGGFVDPEKDTDDEAAARRERGEEMLGITTGEEYEQLGARIKVADPRYRNAKDNIYATLFCTKYRGGVPEAGDDAKGVRWFSREDLRRMIVPWHQPHVERLVARWERLKQSSTAAA